MTDDTQLKAVAPGSVVWIKCSDPVRLISQLDPEVKEYLAARFYVIFTTHDVEITDLDAQTLKAFGLKKIPKVVSDGPIPSPA